MSEINVRVVTSAGSFPEHGHEKAPLEEVVQQILNRAAKELKITDTTNWAAKVKGEEIDASKTYSALALHGEVKIDYGRRESGGG